MREPMLGLGNYRGFDSLLSYQHPRMFTSFLIRLRLRKVEVFSVMRLPQLDVVRLK